MTHTFSINELNSMSVDQFTQALGAIFEHSPWVAQCAAELRPFQTIAQLHQAMATVVRDAHVDERIKLIRAHPELAGKAAMRGELTVESTREQRGAGLDQCSPEEFAEVQDLNQRYNDKFGFPFVIAVKGHDRHSILSHFRKRLGNDKETEVNECIEQIIKIGGFRLSDAISE
ncbi:2-oxo-4-hydroxy-4-carboxy-5-ureidoimidazoline decarboxylase [Undibacterium sp. SXout7W]|uniref:2-oxo-4-hydroxy-4-carboxy-5-ureidoimidazoline decarboxylase n=1 Tax=Undibacterium sp. SXout7W TaxID=3413049 RepID=UPI003BF43FF9